MRIDQINQSINRLCRLAHSISKNHGQPKLAFGLLLRRDSKKGCGGGGGGGAGFPDQTGCDAGIVVSCCAADTGQGGGEDSKVLGFRC